MDKELLLRYLRSINDQVDALGDILNQVHDEKNISSLGITVRSRVPEMTQNPVGDMIARELLPQRTPLKEHDLFKALNFISMSLDVEVPGLIADLEEE